MCCEKTVTDLLESRARGLPEVWSFDSGTHNQHVLGENKTAELKQEKSPADGQFHFFLSSQTAHSHTHHTQSHMPDGWHYVQRERKFTAFETA